MVKVILKGFIFLVFIFLFINSVSASFVLGKENYSIGKSYGPNSELNGWVNLSFNKEPINSIFKGSIDIEEDTITLFNLLKKSSNSNFAYTCDTFNCSSNYIKSNSETSKSFSLGREESKVIGLIINEKEDVIDFSDFSLKITSDSSEETSNSPLSIDILNDNKEEWVAHTPSETFSSANFGCYKEGSSPRQADILTDDWYCERIKLSKSPTVKIGARVIGSQEGDFTMMIEDSDGNYETCTATGVGEISCIPDFAIQNKGNYFVCIQAEDSGYDINFQNNNDYPCGFSGVYEGAYDYDFEIFAQTSKYAPIEEVILNDDESELSTGEIINIGGEIEDYIFQRYNNDCSKDCIIPIKITSETNQEITLSEVSLSYEAGGIGLSENRLYDLSETPAKITSGFQKLYLDDANFYVPNKYGNFTFSLLLGTTKVLSNKVSVGKGPSIKYVTPMSTAVKYPTEFKASLNGSANVTKYMWNFGDGTKQNTTTNKVSHSYNLAGTYELKVIAIDEAERSSSKKINVLVKPASEMVPTLFNEMKENVKNIQKQITTSNFSSFEQNSIIFFFGLNGISQTIAGLNTGISQASSESQFETILGQMVVLNIPKSLEKTSSLENSVFFSDPENINLEVLKDISSADITIENEEAYKNAILAWEGENIIATFTFSEISAYYTSYSSSFLKTFELDITTGGSPSYLIIRDMENLAFGGEYGEQTIGDYVYIPLDNVEEKISFSTTEENIEFWNLPAFISPEISELVVIDESTITAFEPGKMVLTHPVLFAVLVILVILGGIIAWVFLQIWYVKKYEGYLFKNRNNLYNLMNYIEIAKKGGLSDKDITIKLKKAGWTSEQLQYALRKYAGKKSLFQKLLTIDEKRTVKNVSLSNKKKKPN